MEYRFVGKIDNKDKRVTAPGFKREEVLPTIGHGMDWDSVDAGTAKAIASERQKRHPVKGTKKEEQR